MRGYKTIEKIISYLKKWISSAAGRISLILLFISIFLIVFACQSWDCLAEEMINNMRNILFGIATNLLGIIITVTFVQNVIDQQNLKKERKEETAKILRRHRIMQILIEQ